MPGLQRTRIQAAVCRQRLAASLVTAVRHNCNPLYRSLQSNCEVQQGGDDTKDKTWSQVSGSRTTVEFGLLHCKIHWWSVMPWCNDTRRHHVSKHVSIYRKHTEYLVLITGCPPATQQIIYTKAENKKRGCARRWTSSDARTCQGRTDRQTLTVK